MILKRERNGRSQLKRVSPATLWAVSLVLVPALYSGCSSAEKIEQADGTVIRNPDDGKIYLISGGKRHYIPDGPTLHALGVDGVVQNEDESDVNAIPLGAELPRLSTNVIQNDKTKEVFLLEFGKRRYIPDAETIQAMHLDTQLRPVPAAGVAAIPLGAPMPHKSMNGTQ